MYFLALSQAPPPLLRTVASRTPGDGADHQHAGDGLVAEQEADDDRRGHGDDARAATIWRSAARVVMSTTRA